MAHQSGIQASPELHKAFADALAEKSKIRFLKCQIDIEEETLVVSASGKVKGSWRDDYDLYVAPHLKEKEACFMLYRLDETNSHGYVWLFLQFIHEAAKTKVKMIYSSTAATFKKTFGTAHLAEDGSLSGSSADELLLSGYDRHLEALKAPPPLSMQEEERQMVREMEKAEMGVGDRHKTLAGIGFAVSNELEEALKAFQKSQLQYLHVEVSLEGTEELRVAQKLPSLPVGELTGKIPRETPAYVLYRFTHTHEGEQSSPVVFVYSTPGYKCPIKQRMVYSSGKAFFVDLCESLGVVLERKLEIDSPDEVSEANLLSEVHPPVNQGRQKFEKPKAPGRKSKK